jgi:nucleoside 2-deoxyribosyltransferase
MFMISSDLLDAWATEQLPGAAELCENMLLWAAGQSPIPGTKATADGDAIRAYIGAADDPDGLSFANQVLTSKNWIQHKADDQGRYVCQLTFDGWLEVERLRKQRSVSKHAFMAMQFGIADVAEAHSKAFVPGVARAGFELRLVTDNQPAGLIDDQLRVAIRTARFVVADLTHHNRGAYWEAGFAEGLGLPVFYTCEKGQFEDKAQGTHFDTNHMNTVVWSLNDLPSAERQLAAMIRATLPSEAKMEDD